MHHVEGQTFIHLASGSQVTFKGEVNRWHVPGPYLVLGSVARNLDNPTLYSAINAVALPVVSNSVWFPVESPYERTVFIGLQDALLKSPSLAGKVVIEKPITDFRPSPTSDTVRPDFIIHRSSGTLVLEVMGSISAEYLGVKARKLPVMAEIAPVAVFDAVATNKRNAWWTELERMKALLSLWAGGRIKDGAIFDFHKLPLESA
jgi:hypothetical protein